MLPAANPPKLKSVQEAAQAPIWAAARAPLEFAVSMFDSEAQVPLRFVMLNVS